MTQQILKQHINEVTERISTLEQKLFENTGSTVETFSRLYNELRALQLQLKRLKAQARNPRKTVFITSNTVC